jgi:hypothetical protein
MTQLDPAGDKARLAKFERQYEAACVIAMAVFALILMLWR